MEKNYDEEEYMERNKTGNFRKTGRNIVRM